MVPGPGVRLSHCKFLYNEILNASSPTVSLTSPPPFSRFSTSSSCLPGNSSRWSQSVSIQDEIERSYKRIDLSFTNKTEAFRSKTNFELLRGLVVLKLCGVGPLVRRNQELMKLCKKLFGRTIFKNIMRSSFYGHFVAGDSLDEITPKLQKMKQFGVKSILDYSAEQDLTSDEAVKTEMQEMSAVKSQAKESSVPGALQLDSRFTPHSDFADRRKGVASARTYFYESEAACDRNAKIFMDSINVTAQSTEGTGLAAIKMTALGRPHFLLQLSEILWQTQQFYRMLTGSTWENLVFSKLSVEQLLQRLKEFGIKMDKQEVKDWFAEADFDSDGFVDIYEWGRLLNHEIKLNKLFRVVNLKTGTMDSLVKNLPEEEEHHFSNMMHRLNMIVEHAAMKNVRVMIDAEQSYFQPAISRLTLELMRRYNKEKPVIFNTYQSYLKNCLNLVALDLHLARREDFCFSAKLVRGAYIAQERERASKLGYEDPINPTYEATSQMYERVLKAILQEVMQRPQGKVSVMVATHNEDTVRAAVQLMKEYNIGPSQRVICFGQLFGMCDQVSYILGQAGYSVYKYVPYGPVEEVLPYLSRRAFENSTILGKSAKEQQMMAQELRRRLKSGEWFYRPAPPMQLEEYASG